MNADSRNDVLEFCRHLVSERALATHTVNAYRRDIELLQGFADNRDIEQWSDLDHRAARTYPARLHQAGYAGRSIQRALSSARALYRFLLRRQRVRHNPFDGVRAPKSSRELPDTLNVDEASQLVSINTLSDIDFRDRALLELVYSCGLRVAETAALDIVDIDLAERMLTTTGKGSKTRRVPIGRMAANALGEWLLRRTSLATPGETAVFTTLRGSRLGVRAIQKRVDLHGRRQGLPRHVHPHMLRHSFASHLLQSSGDLRAVQELLGHANIATTQIYTHLDYQHLASVYDKAHPRARKKSPLGTP
jgi:integrase/recombinase XerC